jgi:hypothetical protein
MYKVVPSGPDFRVAVNNGGKPVQGLPLKASGSEGTGSYREVTDTKGFAYFRGVAPGAYMVSADHDAGLGDGIGLQVTANGPSNVRVAFRWPGAPTIRVRSLKGTLYMAGGSAEAQPRLNLELQEGITGRILKSTITSEKGDFDFGDAAPGLYFLRIVDPKQAVPVAVDPGAASETIQLQFGPSVNCSSYTDLTKCAKGDLHISSSRGRVITASGRAISAEVALFDQAGSPIKSVSADGQGRFDLGQLADGDYDLQATSPSFTALRRKAHVELTNDPTANELTIQLGAMSACSTAHVQ